MTRRRRILTWTFIPIGGVALLLFLIHVVILPWIVRDRFGALLADAGLKGATFRVPTATLWSAQILDVAFPDSQTRIDRIRVRYGVGGIRRGQLDALRISGLKVAVGVDMNGKIDLGPLAPLMEQRPRTVKTTAPTTRRAREPVPIVRVELVDSAVLLQTTFQKLELPLMGTAVGAENYRYLVDFETELGSAVILSGSFTPSTGVMRLNLEADDADAAKLTQLVTALAPKVNVGIAGKLKVRTSFVWDGTIATLNAQLEAKPTSEPAGEGPNVQVTQGVFQVDATFGGEGGGAMKLSVRDSSFTESSQSIQSHGVSGRLELSTLSPLTSPPNQRLRIERFKAGDTELTSGRLEFQVTDAANIQIEHAQFNWLGGELLAQDFSIGKGEMAVGVQMQKVDLGQLLKTFAKDKASGTGSVSGNVNLKITGSDLVFGVGHLEAAQDGTLQIAEDVANQVSPPQGNATPQQQVGKNIAEALKNFQFISLTAKISPEDRGRLDAKLHGRGATGAKQEITYEPRVTGLNDLVDFVLHVRQAMSAGENAVKGN